MRFLGLVSWPGTNLLHRSGGSAAGSSGLGAGEHLVTVDSIKPLDLAVPQPPTRPGNGKGKSQREFASSLVVISAVAERPEEVVGLLGGEAVLDGRGC